MYVSGRRAVPVKSEGKKTNDEGAGIRDETGDLRIDPLIH
jgi:hypothetical protein